MCAGVFLVHWQLRQRGPGALPDKAPPSSVVPPSLMLSVPRKLPRAKILPKAVLEAEGFPYRLGDWCEDQEVPLGKAVSGQRSRETQQVKTQEENPKASFPTSS